MRLHNVLAAAVLSLSALFAACGPTVITTTDAAGTGDTAADAGAYVCGDGICDDGETCDRDCTVGCGDGICVAGETPATCVEDCPNVCGDGYCGAGEETCLADCGAICGDGVCAPEEPSTCPADCGSVCGDGICAGGEDAGNCAADCSSLCGDGICSVGETTATCVQDCGSTCGDGVCNGAETSVTCATDCGSTCGDGICAPDETATSCIADCPAICGDGVCEGGETSASCVDDCGAACGDGVCNGSETSATCVSDCPAACGDGVCEGDETSRTCAVDCPASCGDGVCSGGEGSTTCPDDCGAACGDGACNGPESSASCYQDCGTSCGDGTCNGTESSVGCADDCGSVCGDGACNGGESTGSCVADCGTACGDGTCNGGETSSSCADDCGAICGDGTCNGPESSATCESDCGTACGDGICNGTESGASCPDDCGTVCGDGICNGGETAPACCVDCADTCASPVTMVGVFDNFLNASGGVLVGRETRWTRQGDNVGGDNLAQTLIYGYHLMAAEGPSDLAIGNSRVDIVRWGNTAPAGQTWRQNAENFFTTLYDEGCRIFVYPAWSVGTSPGQIDTWMANFGATHESAGDPVAIVIPAPESWTNTSALDHSVFGGTTFYPAYMATSSRPYFVMATGVEDDYRPVRWTGYESTWGSDWPVDVEASIRLREVVDGRIESGGWVGTHYSAGSTAGALAYLLAWTRYYGYDADFGHVRDWFLSDGLGTPFTHGGTRYDFPRTDRQTGNWYTAWDELPEDPRLPGVTHQFDDATDRYVTSGTVIKEYYRRGVYAPSSAPAILTAFEAVYPAR